MRFLIGFFTFFVLIGVLFSYPALLPYGDSQRSPSSQTPAIGTGVSKNPTSAPKPQADIYTTLQCWERDDCDYPQTDPRSYSFAVAKDLEAKLSQFHSELQKDPTLAPEAEKIALAAMKVLDGHVQAKAMEIFALLPKDPKYVDAIMGGLENTPDPLLIEQAMKEFERYIGTPEEQRIQEFLAEFIAHGAQFSSEKASEEIFKFLNERSVGMFREILPRMEPNSTPAQYLRAALLEYERTRVGG